MTRTEVFQFRIAHLRCLCRQPTTNGAFAHNTNFTDIRSPAIATMGGDFTLQATGMTPHVGNLFELRVIIASTGQVMGSLRTERSRRGGFQLVDCRRDRKRDQLPNRLLRGSQWQWPLDAPGSGDHAWRVLAAGTATDLTAPFAHNINFTGVGS